MKINFLSVCLSSILIFAVFSCSSSSEYTQSVKKETDSSYVFDKLPPDDIITIENPEPSMDEIFIVQIGAFTSYERAKDFAELSRMKLNHEIKVSTNEKNSLYVVQIHPPFNIKQEAVDYCFRIRNFDEYRDAWVVTIKAGGKK